MSQRPRIEILTFEGCPNARAARERVARVIADTRMHAEAIEVDVESVDAASFLRILGSPTIRVDGHDIEKGADARAEYVFACRVYRTRSGVTGVPDEAWLRDALGLSESRVLPGASK